MTPIDAIAGELLRQYSAEFGGEYIASFRDPAFEVIRALNAAGFAIVPKEPTAAMFTAGQKLVSRHDARCVKTVDWEQVYAAMVAAAEAS